MVKYCLSSTESTEEIADVLRQYLDHHVLASLTDHGKVSGVVSLAGVLVLDSSMTEWILQFPQVRFLSQKKSYLIFTIHWPVAITSIRRLSMGLLQGVRSKNLRALCRTVGRSIGMCCDVVRSSLAYRRHPCVHFVS